MSRRRAATRSRLLAAASAVFTERGFGRATVEDVCERAGYTRGAFYSNFGSLDELFFIMYAARSAELISAVGAAVARAAADIAGLSGEQPSVEQVMDRVVAALPVTREQQLLNIEFLAHALRHADVATGLARHRQDLRQALLPILRMGLRSTGVAPDDRQLDDVARAVVGVHDGMFQQELLEPDYPELAALRGRVMSVVVSSLWAD